MRFREFQRLNHKRCVHAFHEGGGDAWPIENWLLAIAGETGEACNIAKKVIRGDFTLEERRNDLLKELADIITYADLAITRLGARTDEELLRKFDEVSHRRGWRNRIEKIYLAASFIAQDDMRNVRARITAAGLELTSRWLDFEFTTLSDQQVAEIDIEDIDRADATVVCTGTPSTRGGFHFEAGYSLAAGKRVFVVGPRVNNFLCLPAIRQVQSFDQLLEVIHEEI